MGKVFFPQYRRGRDGIDIFDGTILEHARKLGVEIASECGGLGICGRCVVRAEKGAECLSEKTDKENEHSLTEGERLACQARFVCTDRDVSILIKDFGDYSILSESLDVHVELEPFVLRDGGRVVTTLGEDLGAYAGEIYGLAVDVGTTTLVAQVVDLEDGRTIGTFARKNPQIAYGNDVISRIGHTMTQADGLRELQRAVANAINEGLASLEKDRGDIRRFVYDTVAVGNSTMRSIFFGQPVDSLGVIPFEPASLEPVREKARAIGLDVNPKGSAYGPPLIGGHAGADCLADILAAKMWEDENVVLLIDIGTNGEVAIGNKHRLMTASCAAGGAYEGATTKCGVGAIDGAIKNVWITDGRAEYETIGGKPPIGICGSGLIDLLAELLRNGIMSKKAKVQEEFFLTEQISITQEDIYQLITAKAGLRTDQDLLMQYYGVALDEVKKIYLAGAFGNFITPHNAIAIGLLPPAPEKVVRIGNSALAGARQMLLSQKEIARAEQIASNVKHVKPNELEPEFAYMVAERMYF